MRQILEVMRDFNQKLNAECIHDNLVNGEFEKNN